MSNEIDQEGLTEAELAREERVQQVEAIHSELHYISTRLTSPEDRALIGLLWDRVSYVNGEAGRHEMNSAHWEAIAASFRAIAEMAEAQRDKTVDEFSEYITGVRDGSHPDVKALIEETHNAAFAEFQENANRLIEMAQKLRHASSMKD